MFRFGRSKTGVVPLDQPKQPKISEFFRKQFTLKPGQWILLAAFGLTAIYGNVELNYGSMRNFLNITSVRMRIKENEVLIEYKNDNGEVEHLKTEVSASLMEKGRTYYLFEKYEGIGRMQDGGNVYCPIGWQRLLGKRTEVYVPSENNIDKNRLENGAVFSNGLLWQRLDVEIKARQGGQEGMVKAEARNVAVHEEAHAFICELQRKREIRISKTQDEIVALLVEMAYGYDAQISIKRMLRAAADRSAIRIHDITGEDGAQAVLERHSGKILSDLAKLGNEELKGVARGALDAYWSTISKDVRPDWQSIADEAIHTYGELERRAAERADGFK